VDNSRLDLELAMTLKLRKMFPDLPEDIMMKAIPRLEAVKSETFGTMLPWKSPKEETSDAGKACHHPRLLRRQPSFLGAKTVHLYN